MRIIGTNGSSYSDEEFICTVSRHELQRLCGYYYQAGAVEPKLSVGTTIDIYAMYSLASRALEIRKQLAGAVTTMRACAELIDGQVALITPKAPEAP